MQQILIGILNIGVWVIPLALFAVFVFFLFRKTNGIKATENTIGFLCASAIVILIPFLVYLLGIISLHKGFSGYYLLIPGIFSELHASDKKALFFFVFYLLSNHILLVLPFLAIFNILMARRRLSQEIYNILRSRENSDNAEIRQIKDAAERVRLQRKIPLELEVAAAESSAKYSVLGLSALGVVKRNGKIILLASRRFLESFAQGLISREELDAVLHHEFSHITNRDYLIPMLSRAVIKKPVVLGFYFPVCAYTVISSKYAFFSEAGFARHDWIASIPLPVSAALLALAFSSLLGLCLWAVSWFLQRCEIIADNHALEFVSGKAMSGAIVKLGIIAESGSHALFSFASRPAKAIKENSLWEDIMISLRTLNVFSDYNKTYFHPNLSERIRLLENPDAIAAEDGGVFLRLDVFLFVSFLIMAVSVLFIIMSGWVIRDPGLPDMNSLKYFKSLNLIFVIIACFPLAHAGRNLNLFKDEAIQKAVLAYSVIAILFAGIYPLFSSLEFLSRNSGHVQNWPAWMYPFLTVSAIGSLLLQGFVFSVCWFFVFIMLANIALKISGRKSSLGKTL